MSKFSSLQSSCRRSPSYCVLYVFVNFKPLVLLELTSLFLPSVFSFGTSELFLTCFFANLLSFGIFLFLLFWNVLQLGHPTCSVSSSLDQKSSGLGSITTLASWHYTVMNKNIGTPALLSDYATLLPENGCNDKCFGIHCLHWNNTINLRKNAKSDLILYKTPKMDWTKLLAPST